MKRIIAVISLALAGCPNEAEVDEPEAPFDFLAGEGTEWKWGEPYCVIYMRDANHTNAEARWFNGGHLVRSGLLSGRDNLRRGFYTGTGKLAVELGGTIAKRYLYDADGRLAEIVQRQMYGRVYRTTFEHDAGGRMTWRFTERVGYSPLAEQWTYGRNGAMEWYRAESQGRVEKELAVVYAPSGQLLEVREQVGSAQVTYAFTHVGSKLTHVHVSNPPYEIDHDYEYDGKSRIVAHTIQPNMQNEAGARTELVYDDTAILERRELTANGFMKSRSIFERSANRDVRVATDSNADGEADQWVDLRDECNGYIVPEFQRVFSPAITIEGEPPYRPDLEYLD